MNLGELIDFAIKNKSEGKIEMAINLFKECANMDPFNPVPHANLYEIYRNIGQLGEARMSLIRFLNAYQTGITIDSVPKAKNDLAELEKQIAEKK